MIIWSSRIGSASPASAPTGWTALSSNGNNGSDANQYWVKIAASSSETSGTFTSATALICHVYRGVGTTRPLNAPIAGIGAANNAGLGASTNIFYVNSSQILNSPSFSWIVAFGGVNGTTSTIENAPTGLTAVTDLVGASGEYASFDSNGIYLSNGVWPSTSVALGVSLRSLSTIIELIPDQIVPNNYQFLKVGNGMSVGGDKIR